MYECKLIVIQYYSFSIYKFMFFNNLFSLKTNDPKFSIKQNSDRAPFDYHTSHYIRHFQQIE